ncbi:MAG: NAD-binding protein [Gemmatimonadota bacterium]
MKRFVVIGLGRFGSWVGRSLHRRGFDVIAIDSNGDLVDRWATDVTRAVVGDATDVNVLRRAGVAEADAAIVSTGDDLAASILAILALKELGVAHIVAKAANTRAAQALDRFDVDEIVHPEREAAERLAYRLGSTSVLEYIPLGDAYSIQELAVPDAWIGKSLRELDLRGTAGIQVVALYDLLSSEWETPPAPDRVLTESVLAIVAGPTETLERLVSQARREG